MSVVYDMCLVDAHERIFLYLFLVLQLSRDAFKYKHCIRKMFVDDMRWKKERERERKKEKEAQGHDYAAIKKNKK